MNSKDAGPKALAKASRKPSREIATVREGAPTDSAAGAVDGFLAKHLQGLEGEARVTKMRQILATLECAVPATNAAACVTAFPALMSPMDFKVERELIAARLGASPAEQRLDAKRLMLGQAIAMDGVATNLLWRASRQDTADGLQLFLSLAMRAQASSRQAAEAWNEMDSPQVVFAKHANLVNGHQQVNVHPRAEGAETANELLEVAHVLDNGAAPATGAGHSSLDAVEAFNRAEDRGGQSRVSIERDQARSQVRRGDGSARRDSRPAGGGGSRADGAGRRARR